MRLTTLDIDPPLLTRLVGLVLDRPVLEAHVRRLAGQPRMDLQARTKEDLSQALLIFAKKQPGLDEQLFKDAQKATAMERDRLARLDHDWANQLRPAFEQKRTGGKFLMAMFLSAEPWPARAKESVQAFLDAAETLKRAEAAGFKDTLVRMEQEFSDAHKRSTAMEQKLMDLERERAQVVAQLGQREAELKQVGQKAHKLERELSQIKKAPTVDSSEADGLKKKLRRLEKQAAFARERERDREMLHLVEHERDLLLKELHVLRLQVQVQTVSSLVQRTFSSQPKPKDEKPPEETALYIDGANLSGIARALHDRKVNFAALRDLLAPNGGLLRAYVLDDGKASFDGFAHALKQLGYSVRRRVLKKLPDGTVKGNMDVQLAVDVMTEQPGPTRVVLVTGDSDFVPLVTALKNRQVRVEAAMFKARTARELLNVVDCFWPLDEGVLL